MRDLATFASSPHFSTDEKLVLQLAVALTQTPSSVDDALYGSMSRRFREHELVELSAAIAWENYRARFNRAFNIAAENFSEGQFCPLPER